MTQNSKKSVWKSKQNLKKMLPLQTPRHDLTWPHLTSPGPVHLPWVKTLTWFWAWWLEDVRSEDGADTLLRRSRGGRLLPQVIFEFKLVLWASSDFQTDFFLLFVELLTSEFKSWRRSERLIRETRAAIFLEDLTVHSQEKWLNQSRSEWKRAEFQLSAEAIAGKVQ